MKVRIYSPFLPYPVTEGAFRVIFDQAFSLLALGHEVELVTWKNSAQEFKERSQLWTNRKGNLTPRFQYLGPQTDSQSLRVLFSLFGTTASPEYFYYPQAIANRLAELSPCDLAIYHYSFAHLWLTTPELLPIEKRRVVHFHNLESDLSELRANNSKAPQKWIHRINSAKLQFHERALLKKCQELWFLSPVDLATFQSRVGATLQIPVQRAFSGSGPASQTLSRLVPPTFSSDISLWSEPNATNENQTLPPENQAAPTSNQTVLGFIGGFDFQPNIDSALWILNNLVPALEKVGFQGKIRIAGRGAQAALKPLVGSPLVEILPEDFDLERFFSELSWMLVPHLTGSGVRIKLLDALARKIPVMATPSAVERLHPEIQKYPLIFSSSDPTHWAEQIMLESAQSTRLKYRRLAFPPAMNGMEIYGNV